MQRRLKAATFLLTTVAVVTRMAIPAAAQEPPTFSESAEVTALDLLVEVEGGKLSSPGTLEPGELGLSVDGKAEDIERIYPGAPLKKPFLTGDDAWSILIWLGADLSSTYQLRWAAASLSQLTTELTSLGEVELVLADPQPHRLLAPTRDAATLETALSRLAVEAIGADRPSNLRYDYVVERTAPTLGMEQAELARAFAAEEQRIVLAHQDALLLGIDERSASSRRRRLLLLVSGGFEVAPATNYGTPLDDRPLHAESLATETEAWLRCLAAYGWITVPFLAPELDHPLRGGFTLGKLRLYWGGPLGMVGFHGPYEEDRDPQRAAAYVLLGRSLREQGRLEDAAETFELALHHYYDDKKTAAEQGVAWLELGTTLARLGTGAEALRAWQLGAQRLCQGRRREISRPEPWEDCIPIELGETVPGAGLLAASRLRGELILSQAAEITSGWVARERESLLERLRDLAERLRVTYQLSALEPGRLFAVELSSSRGSVTLRYPGWARSGSPERLATARLRHLLTDGPLDGDAGLVVHASADPRTVVVEVPDALLPEGPAPLGPVRLSWGWFDEEEVRVLHELRTTPPEGTAWRLERPPLPEAAEAAIMVEVLFASRWAAAVEQGPRGRMQP